MDHIRVLLVDDHAFVRETLSERLRTDPCFTVVGMAGTAGEAVEQATQHQIDVIVMEIDMPGLRCFDAAHRIKLLQPDVRFLFFSAYVHDHYIEQALNVGALGYLTKSESPATVVAAIKKIAANHACFSDEIKNRIMVDADRAGLGSKAKSRASTLTRRETEILSYIARGMAKKEIARLMHISVKTVDKHSSNLMVKLNIHDRVELARFAIREGFVEL